jgi:ATP-binding cassette subfamily F protein 3
VARKALSRERRLAREMRSAAWVADPQTRPTLTLAFPEPPGERPRDGDVLVELPALDVVVGGRTLLRTSPLRLGPADRVLLEGRNGAGKTSLLRRLAPMLPGAAVLPQTHEQLPLSMPALDFFRSRTPMYVEDAERVLEGFLFDRADRGRPLGRLSTGQVRLLLLATLLNRPSRMLVLDEPTNHLDFDSLDVLERALAGWGGALLVVTHDEELAQRIGLTQRWRVADGRLESAA